MPHTYSSLCHASNAELEAVLKAGVRPKLDALGGSEFRGFNTPAITRLLGIRKFKKGFRRGDHTPAGTLDGYNVRERQSSFEEPWIDVEKNGAPYRHGFYRVVEPTGAWAAKYPGAWLLDYSLGENAIYDPAQLLRDFLTQVDPKNPDLLLGTAYLALGPLWFHASYFVLDRVRADAAKAPKSKKAA